MFLKFWGGTKIFSKIWGGTKIFSLFSAKKSKVDISIYFIKSAGKKYVIPYFPDFSIIYRDIIGISEPSLSFDACANLQLEIRSQAR